MRSTAPLPPARPLLSGEAPHTAASLAASMATTAAEALAELHNDLGLLAACPMAPPLLQKAEELHGCAVELSRLAARFARDAAAAA